MAQEDEKTPPQSTNVLLAQILSEAKETNTTLKAQLKVQSDTRDLTQKLVDAIVGELHNFTVKVEQIHKAVVKVR